MQSPIHEGYEYQDYFTVKLRKKADGQWCLWEQYLLTDIRQPKADAPWA